MLSQLYIENVAVIEKVSVDFHSGFSVLTGETGAGKSILIDSINAILGERTSREIVRTGAKSAFVSAVFTDLGSRALKKLEELGYSSEEDGTLMVQREISADSKSSCRINGRPATVSVLKEIGPLLVNIHGQHESYGLLSPENHIGYLDSMGLPQNLSDRYHSAFDEARHVKRELDSLNMDEAQKARQIDLLTYQIKELEEADLKEGEQEELSRRKAMFRNSEKIASAISSAKEALDGSEDSDGAVSSVSSAASSLNEAERYLPELHSLAERLQNISYDLEDCSSELRGYSGQLEYDPDELEQIESRLDTIYRLGLKYGGSVENMLQFLSKSKAELEKIQLSDETVTQLREQYKKSAVLAQKLAFEISDWRSKTAHNFAMQVKKELEFLNMPNVSFEVRLERCSLNSKGCDKVEFLISTNAGEPAKPIAKIASGGELSRIMLAVKRVLADHDDVGTLIFDEVDTGVSGGAAQKIGLKLREVSESRQVVCVTHLAQIAALADTQYLIQKQVRSGKTYTEVQKLDDEGRKHELARIIGGAEITPLTLQNAAEMLKMAHIKEKSP
ncbi:MAG TPA: DNA repair protein RecN [Caproicibacter sp.]|nr:DNA repair protein RecN [Caproicibacter sp.]